MNKLVLVVFIVIFFFIRFSIAIFQEIGKSIDEKWNNKEEK